ncbi:LppX_LprAFG lipoprotein [Tsukamurella serpentis]
MIARNTRHTVLRLTTTAVVLLTALGLVAGCSSSSAPADDRPLPDAKAVVDASSASARALRDVRLDLSVDGTVPNLPVKSVGAYLTKDPKTGGQGDADVIYQGSAIKAKFIVTGGDLWVQLAPGQPYNRTGPAADVYDASAILDPEKGIAKLISSVREPKVEGREQIGGTATVRLSGTIPGAALAGIVPKATLGDRPVTFWVQDEAPNNLVRVHVGFDSGTLSVTLSDWGKKVPLLDPKTAK